MVLQVALCSHAEVRKVGYSHGPGGYMGAIKPPCAFQHRQGHRWLCSPYRVHHHANWYCHAYGTCYCARPYMVCYPNAR